MWVEVGTVPAPAQLKQSQGLRWTVRERLSSHPGACQMWAMQEASSAPLTRLGGVANRQQLREGRAQCLPGTCCVSRVARIVALRAGEGCTLSRPGKAHGLLYEGAAVRALPFLQDLSQILGCCVKNKAWGLSTRENQ